MHWEVDADVLRRRVPARLSLDAYEGKHYVGLVPFRMQDTRTSWMPRGAGLNFLETNLRAYVHYEGRPGVYFFSLEAASWLAVRVARAVWKLPYHHATMATHETVVTGAADEVHYMSRRKDGSGADLDVRFRVGDALGPSAPGTLEHFLLERYLLFSERGDTLLEGQVHHVPYPAHRAEVVSLEEGLVAAAGLDAPGRPPDLAHYAPGVDVEVFGPWPV